MILNDIGIGRYFSTHTPVDDMFINGQSPTYKMKLVGVIDLTI